MNDGNIRSLDVTSAGIVIPESFRGTELKCVQVLQEEVCRRCGIHLEVEEGGIPQTVRPVIHLATTEHHTPLPEESRALLESVAIPGAEGFRLVVSPEEECVLILGSDARGLLYGIGRFLTLADFANGMLTMVASYAVSETPVNSLRGHQLGYRPLANAYEAWSVEQFDQYIRELALFGANAIEILPPSPSEGPGKELMQEDPLEMMVKLSELIDSYGLDVWVWYPNVEKNLEDREVSREALKERAAIFRQLKRIDAVFIPGGDPGDVHPDVLFPFAEAVGAVLAEHHADAKIWLSAQNFHLTQEWVDSFLEHVNRNPSWLGGVVSGPWEKYDLNELRGKIPERYPIRNYPDVSHNYLCQYPVRDWDEAFVMTLGRESVNPRPDAFKYIHNQTSDAAFGSIGYSEGIYDDCNKFLWLALEWNPSASARAVIRQYVRLFISQEAELEITDALFGLEANWRGPLLSNSSVEFVFNKWQNLFEELPVDVSSQYRFLMGWLRACCDYAVKLRLLHETQREERALDCLRNHEKIGVEQAVSEAVQILSEDTKSMTWKHVRRECDAIADRLFASIGAQLTVEKHHAYGVDRGAFIDSLDTPLTSAPWLLHHLKQIEALCGSRQQVESLKNVLGRYHGGGQDRYISFRSGTDYSSFVHCSTWEADPGNYHTPYLCTAAPLLYRDETKETFPRHALSFYTSPADTPIKMDIDGLKPQDYRLKVTYVKDIPGHWHKEITLTANNDYIIHRDYCIEAWCDEPEFTIPRSLLADGSLKLTWTTKEGQRGPNIAAVGLSRISGSADPCKDYARRLHQHGL